LALTLRGFERTRSSFPARKQQKKQKKAENNIQKQNHVKSAMENVKSHPMNVNWGH